MSTAEIFSFIISVGALIISIFSNLNTKRAYTLQHVTQNRIDWIKDVRSLVSKFINLYKKNDSLIDLEITRNQIALYLRKGVKSYDNLLKALDMCIANPYDKKYCDQLIMSSQNAFSEVWIRIKRESGMTKNEDQKFEKAFGNLQNMNKKYH